MIDESDKCRVRQDGRLIVRIYGIYAVFALTLRYKLYFLNIQGGYSNAQEN